MTPGSPSATMSAVCAVRAEYAEELGDELAARIVPVLPDASGVRSRLDAGSRGMFSRSVRVRSLFVSSAMRQAASLGAQLVVLSAGLDFRGLSEDGRWADRARVFVDHPASQAIARDLLQRIGVSLSPRVAFVPMDLASFPGGALASALADARVEPDRPTLVVWEGATYYLEPPAVLRALDEIAAALRHVRFVGDFLQQRAYLGPDGRPINEGVARNLEYLRSLGEAWVGFFDDVALGRALQAMGFGRVDVVAREEVERDLLGEVRMANDTMFFIDARKGWGHEHA